MRGNIGFGVRLPNSNISNARQTLLPFSTFSNSGGGGGSGRGRGRGSSLSGLGPFDLNGRAPGKPDIDKSKLESLESPESSESPVPPSSGLSGLGHGRGKPSPPPPSSSGLTSFSSFISSLKQSSATGRGQSTGPVMPQPANESGPRKPTLFKREDGTSSSPTVGTGTDASTRTDDHETDHHKGERNILGLLAGSPVVDHCPVDVMGALSGFGRGKPMKQEGPQDQVKEENKHLRAPRRAPDTTASKTVSMSQEDAVKNARKILSQGRDDGSSAGRGRGGFIGGRGRGRGRGSERFAGRGRGERDLFDLDFKDTSASRQYVEEEDDSGELLAQKVGPEVMNQLTEGFEELADRVLPTPFQDEYLDALDINCAIEFEPEYLMGEFDRNPDIDDKPPIPLRDALEKMKPFLMAYEGIQSQEEWEEIMEETMARVPLLKKIVDHYCGPDRVTAKKQQEELERVAKSLPQSAPSSVKRFADRAVLSLQSNPGWGFDKKCQFMDKLVWEASQHYK